MFFNNAFILWSECFFSSCQVVTEKRGDNLSLYHSSQESAGIEKPDKVPVLLKEEVSSHNESAAAFLLSEAFASRPGD